MIDIKGRVSRSQNIWYRMETLHSSGYETPTACELCGEPLHRAASVTGLALAPLLQCACGLVMTVPRPTSQSIGEFYPNDYGAYRVNTRGHWSRWIGKIVSHKGRYPNNEAIWKQWVWAAIEGILGRHFITNIPYMGVGKRLLDVGCGSGKLLLWAQEHTWAVAGVDPSPNAIAAARSQGLLDVQIGAADALPHPPNSFDCVLLSHSLEHVHHPRKALREVARVLRPGGNLIVVVPNFESVFRIAFGADWQHLDIPRHLYHFTPHSLCSLAAAEGFENRALRFASFSSALVLNTRSVKNSSGASGIVAGVPRMVRATLNCVRTSNCPEGRIAGDVIWSLWSRSENANRRVN